MKFQLFDIGITTPSDWRIRVTEQSSYKSGRMAIVSPKKMYIAVQWQPLETLLVNKAKKAGEKTKEEDVFSLEKYLDDVFAQTQDKKIRDLKVLENVGSKEDDHEFRFIRVKFDYKKRMWHRTKPQEYVGYLILCNRLNRLIGAFTNLPAGVIQEDITYLEGPMRTIICLCSQNV
ncbi:MAG: hypothetical protein ACUVQ5_06285 [Candidatus Methanomethylicaceae archaeon]